MKAAASTTTVQRLVNDTILKSQQPDSDSGTQEGVIGHTPAGEPIACGVAWTSRSQKAHIERITFEPEPHVEVTPDGDWARPEKLGDALWDAEQAMEEAGVTFDDVISESGVEYADPDTDATWWKGGPKRERGHYYWIADVDALISYIRDEYPPRQ